MVDTQTALEAHRNLTWIADHWPELKAHLHPPRGGAMTGMPVALGDGGVPINIHVSDLLHTITVEAESLARVLWDELDEPASFTPRTTMPDLLRDVAARYGHWTAQDERTALAFCDWAHEYRWRVWRVITQPDPARYIGPCPAAECEGELYLKPGRNLVRCPECGRDVRMEEQVEWLHAQMESHLLERDELHPALRILGHEVTRDQVRKWIERERIEAVGDGLFRLRDAIDLATRPTRGRIGA